MLGLSKVSERPVVPGEGVRWPGQGFCRLLRLVLCKIPILTSQSDFLRNMSDLYACFLSHACNSYVYRAESISDFGNNFIGS